MDPLTISAASGMRSRLESLDLLANNLSNAATAGYKADREFHGVYASEEALASGEAAAAPVIERNWIDFTQGSLTMTGNPLDLALHGKGFLVADGPEGPLYTRSGNLRVSAAGILETQDGYPVRAATTASDRRIRLRPGENVEIDSKGQISQAGEPGARLEVVEFPNPEALTKRGGNYFRLMKPEQGPVPAAGATVQQGALESSNAGPAEGAVRLINVMRQFEMLQRALTLGGEMNKRAVEEVARVNG